MSPPHPTVAPTVAARSPHELARRARAGAVLRALCLLAALTNIGGNALLLAFPHDLLGWLGLPPPPDPFTLAGMSGLSLVVGVGALLVWLDPPRSTRLLLVCALAKGTFALICLAFYARGQSSWLWMALGAWDAALACGLALYLIHLLEPELAELNAISPAVRPDDAPGPAPAPGKALLVYFSLTGSGKQAVERVARGLESRGYACTPLAIAPREQDLFRFPFERRLHLPRIMARAVLRVPAAIEPIRLDPDHDHDLVVCATPTWMLGMAAPVEAALADPALRRAIRGRDVALVNVSRGSWQRSQAMMADRVRAAGGRLVATSPHVAMGREPARLLSLFCMLVRGRMCGRLPPSRPDEAAYLQLEELGRRLAGRRPGLPGYAADTADAATAAGAGAAGAAEAATIGAAGAAAAGAEPVGRGASRGRAAGGRSNGEDARGA